MSKDEKKCDHEKTWDFSNEIAKNPNSCYLASKLDTNVTFYIIFNRKYLCVVFIRFYLVSISVGQALASVTTQQVKFIRFTSRNKQSDVVGVILPNLIVPRSAAELVHVVLLYFGFFQVLQGRF